MLIKEILTIDLSEDIKNVIDLEDFQESAIQHEIENYIVTEGLAKEYSYFVDQYTSNKKETGAWISGFYGSGKSYFGKILGYLISNQLINGTPARDRILQRFSGLSDEQLIKNAILRLASVNSRVIFLDIAKQDTSKGFPFTLFLNFLSSIGLPKDEHGYLLYQVLIGENEVDPQTFIEKHLSKDWSIVKSKTFQYTKVVKELILSLGQSEQEYQNLLETTRRTIDQFSAGKLRDELLAYLSLNKDETIAFFFDEASEALNQKKISLLDLEGVSEALTALAQRVWTVAIAQERLDDVIKNANSTKAELTKVTDRFVTKVHLEATEVHLIIQNRLLKKTEQGLKQLKSHYDSNSGKIADHAGITGAGISKTDSWDSYKTYYPFYKYQFDLLQNFLFGTKGYGSTKVAARGMIITTYDILKQELQKSSLYQVASGWQLTKEAQQQPPARLVSRYQNADRIIQQEGCKVDGRKLLETIHFLTESEVTPAILSNIVKSYANDANDIPSLKSEMTKALEILVEAKVLLPTNNAFRITSDIEQRLLDEMNGFDVRPFIKKSEAIKYMKSSDFVRKLSKANSNGENFDFYITSDNDDELTSPSQKYLNIKLKSVYTLNPDRTVDIEKIRHDFKDAKNQLWMVPDNARFSEIDRLIEDMKRIEYIEERYPNPDSDEGNVIKGFTHSKGEKEEHLKKLMQAVLESGTAIYLFDLLQLDSNNWLNTVNNKQQLMIESVYSKRLSSQLSDVVAAKIIKENNQGRLHTYFHGDDFKFFDAAGNFIGDNLKVVEEVTFLIRNTFVDGATLEKELEKPPTNYNYGTVVSTVAVLMRAGKLLAKYNGDDVYSWKDEKAVTLFSAAREFRKATFKAISKSLSTKEQQDIARTLMDLDVEKHLVKKIDFNTHDIELMQAVRDLAVNFSNKVTSLQKAEPDFNALFPDTEKNKELLNEFTVSISEANYIEKAKLFLDQVADYADAIESIESVEAFVYGKLPQLKGWKHFGEKVESELTKAAKPDTAISKLVVELTDLYKTNAKSNYGAIQGKAQKIKDAYHKLFSDAMLACATKYTAIELKAQDLLSEIASLPEGLNLVAAQEVDSQKSYATLRKNEKVDLDFDVQDKSSKFSYSEVLSFVELADNKSAQLDILKASLIRVKPAPAPPSPGPTPAPIPQPKKFAAKLPGKHLKVAAYKTWLTSELQKLASASDNDDVEIEDQA